MNDWDLDEYHAAGFTSRPAALSRAEVDDINRRLDAYLATSDYGVVAEDGQAVPRAVHGLHLVEPFFRELCERPLLLDAAEGILRRPVYVHQLKVNLKTARVGERWPWHQDFIFWHELDGIAHPDLVNVAIYLSDADSASGPLEYVPGSHRWGNICKRPQRPTEGGSAWHANVGRDLTFQACPDEVAARAAGHPPVASIRAAGDIDLFHPQLVHGSHANLSRHDRRLLIITYNAIDNLPRAQGRAVRPEFLCSRDFTPARAWRAAAAS